MFSKQKILLILKVAIWIAMAFLTIFIFAQKSELTSLDLGRHIKNGEVVWRALTGASENFSVLYKNFYSFTEPNFPFVNHHWLSGLIFYWIYVLGSFTLLSLFNILTALALISIVFFNTKKRSNFWLAGIILLPAILILSERVDIRPEMVSYLLLAIVFYLLSQWRKEVESVKNLKDAKSDFAFRKIKNKHLYWLIAIQFFWANYHIYFFLGLFLISLALLEQIILKHKNFFKFDYCKKLLYITVACYAVGAANPNFVKGLIYPFTILREYGYEVAENKSLFFMQARSVNYNFLIFKIFFILLIISCFINIFVKRRVKLFELGVSLFFSFLGFFAVRNLPLTALMIAPITAGNFYEAFKNKFTKFDKQKLCLGIAVFTLAAYILAGLWLINDYKGERIFVKAERGLGLKSGSEESIDFFRDNNLSGPIFNNYDLGSALIFWLYPKESVFVDNRPEAFSADFFRKTYMPMQEDSEKWKESSEQYNINLIYFSHTDGTPWAKKFLRARLHDEEWPLIFFDKYTVIMIKNEEENRALIEKYKINNDEFKERIKELSANANNRNLINLADLALSYGDVDLAREIYEGILTAHPQNRQTLALMGYLFSGGKRKSDIIQALDYFSKAINRGYRLPAIYNQMGLNYWSLRDYNEAKKMWEKALKLDSDNDHALYYLEQVK